MVTNGRDVEEVGSGAGIVFVTGDAAGDGEGGDGGLGAGEADDAGAFSSASILIAG